MAGRTICNMFNNPPDEGSGRDEYFSGQWPFGGKVMLWPRSVKDSEGNWVAPPENQPQWQLKWYPDDDSGGSSGF